MTALLSEKNFLCPYCGRRNEIGLDGNEGRSYELATDCEVCCRPIIVSIRTVANDCTLEARAENA